MYWHDGPGVGADWWVMGLVMLLIWGIVIAAIVLLVRWVWTSSRSHDAVPPGSQHGHPEVAARPAEGAQRILDERFARGEIDEEEYRQRRDVLRGGRDPHA